MNSCNIITLDYRGSGEPVCGVCLAHHHPRRTGWTPLRRNSGKLSCLSARPPDIATMTAARAEVSAVRPSTVSCPTAKRAGRRRSPSSENVEAVVLSPFCVNHSSGPSTIRPAHRPPGPYLLGPLVTRSHGTQSPAPPGPLAFSCFSFPPPPSAPP